MLDVEFSILDFIQNQFRTPFGDFVMLLISKLGNGGIIWLVLSGLLCVFPKYRKAGVTMLTALALDVLLCNVMLKPLVGRMRPFTVNTGMELLINAPKDFSFHRDIRRLLLRQPLHCFSSKTSCGFRL